MPSRRDFLKTTGGLVLATGAAWTAEHPGTFLLSLADAFRLARLANRATFGAGLNAIPAG